MTDHVEEISYRSYPSKDGRRKTWFITFDGVVLGDSRGYSTIDEVEKEACRIVDENHADCLKMGIHGTRVLRPGY